MAGPDSSDVLLAELLQFSNAHGFPLKRTQVADNQLLFGNEPALNHSCQSNWFSPLLAGFHTYMR